MFLGDSFYHRTSNNNGQLTTSMVNPGAFEVLRLFSGSDQADISITLSRAAQCIDLNMSHNHLTDQSLK